MCGVKFLVLWILSVCDYYMCFLWYEIVIVFWLDGIFVFFVWYFVVWFCGWVLDVDWLDIVVDFFVVCWYSCDDGWNGCWCICVGGRLDWVWMCDLGVFVLYGLILLFFWVKWWWREWVCLGWVVCEDGDFWG